MTVIVIATLHPKSGATADMLRVIGAPLRAIQAEDGCELFAAHAAPDGSIVLIEKWASQAALDAHSIGDAVQQLRAARAPYEAAPAEVVKLAPVPGASGKGAL